MRIIICGAGIGGLTAALCLVHYGHDVTLIEQAAELGEIGAGLQVSPNAMRVFQALGMEEQIAQHAFRPEAIETRMGESGQTLFRIPLMAGAEPIWGAPYYHVHRADFIAALWQVLESRAPGCVRLDAALSAYEQDEAGVSVHLVSGEHLSGDVLIGADGIHSAVRTHMLGAEAPVFTGHMAWRAVVPIEQLGDKLPPPTACAWMGRGRHAVTYRLRGGALANFVGVVERNDWTGESWTEPGSKREALDDFVGWHPAVTRLVEAADTLYRWALFDRPPLRSWTAGRVALLGDAAHPMLPFLAQGAAMAVEDGWVLARELTAAAGDPAAGLTAYQGARFARTSHIQAASRANGKIFHRQTLAGRLMTYGPMWLGGRIAPGSVRRRMDRIYAHDVTA